MHKSIVFIITSYWSYGELLIALEFASMLDSSKYKSVFLTSPSHCEKVREKGFDATPLIPHAGKINRILMMDLNNRLNLVGVILCDYLNYHFCEKNYGLVDADLEIFECPVGTIDIFDWDHRVKKMDVYGRVDEKLSSLNYELMDFSFVPCPLGNTIHKNPMKEYYVLFAELGRITVDEKKNAKLACGFLATDQVLITTSATWQKKYKKSQYTKELIEASERQFRHTLLELSNAYHVIVIGEYDDPSGRIQVIPHLMPSDFDVYSKAADIFLSMNMTSTTGIKMALRGIKTVVLTHSIHKYRATNTTSDYSFRMFPVGWYEFLEPLIEDNLYFDLLYELELFDDDLLGKLTKLDNHDKYIDELEESFRTLKTPMDLIESLEPHIKEDVI